MTAWRKKHSRCGRCFPWVQLQCFIVTGSMFERQKSEHEHGATRSGNKAPPFPFEVQIPR